MTRVRHLVALLAFGVAFGYVEAAVVFYLRLDLRFGVLMAALLGLSLWAGAALAAGSTAYWLAWGIGLFVVGWVFQFIGHAFEGKPPEFLKDWRFLFVGLRWWFAKMAGKA